MGGYASMRVLDFLRGQPMNDIARAYISALRPTSMRVIRPGDMVKSDVRNWRVTVYLDHSGAIGDVEQEVAFESDAYRNGHELSVALATQKRELREKACPDCGIPALVPAGSCQRCTNCGSTTGCG